MTTSPAAQSLKVLTGVPVVSGLQYAPVIRPGRVPAVDDLAAAPDIDEAGRAAEAARFTSAAAAVAERLRNRAAQATGVAAEVLSATALLAQDRAWLGAAEKRIKAGSPARAAVAAAVEQFVDMFTKLGGLMAERVTDLRDIRDRMGQSWFQRNADYIVAGALIVGGIAVMATGVGGPIGAAMIGGALLSAGASAGIQKVTTGSVNYKEVAVAGLVATLMLVPSVPSTGAGALSQVRHALAPRVLALLGLTFLVFASV